MLKEYLAHFNMLALKIKDLNEGISIHQIMTLSRALLVIISQETYNILGQSTSPVEKIHQHRKGQNGPTTTRL